PPSGNRVCVLASTPAQLIGPRSLAIYAGGCSLIFAVKLLTIAVAELFARTVGSRPRCPSEKPLARRIGRHRVPGRTVSTAVSLSLAKATLVNARCAVAVTPS